MSNKKIRIACICNLNQTQYVIARYLRDMGYQVTLFLVNEYDHFLPEADTCNAIFGLEIVKLPDLDMDQLITNKYKNILRQLRGYDIYFGSELAPAILTRAGIRCDYFIPIGTDLTSYPFYHTKNKLPYVWEFRKMAFSKLQKKGIAAVKHLFLVKNGDPYYEACLKKINFQGKRYDVSLPLLYQKEYETCTEENSLIEQIKAEKGQGHFVGLSTSRIEFLKKDSEHYKGTDILLIGFTDFCKIQSPNAKLYLVEYGSDVEAAKSKISELGLEKNIVWMPKLKRKEIMQMIPLADVAFGNLGRPAVMYNVVMEMIASGTPVAQLGTPDPKPYPYFRVENAGDISSVLAEYNQDKTPFLAAAAEAKAWFEMEAIQKPLDLLKDSLKGSKYGNTGKTNFGLKWQVFKLKLAYFGLRYLEKPHLFISLRVLKQQAN